MDPDEDGRMDTEEDILYSEVGNYFLNNEKLHDVQFLVGEQKVKIKAVRLQLINQSEVWWSMLSEDSPLVDKDDIHLPDIDPEVFNLLLMHSYGGLSDLDDLSDDMVIKLCYCANKYFMKSLFKKITQRLQPKAVQDVFAALHCMVYYNLQGVEEGVKEIVQNQTRKILDHPDFLECDVDSVTYICKQERLDCDEVTLWKAVVKWAKHRAQGDEVVNVRRWIDSPLQHIRLTTLSLTDLRNHVFKEAVLSCEEIANISKGDVSSTKSLCIEKRPRKYLSVRKVDVARKTKWINCHYEEADKCTSCFVLNDKPIELQSVVVRGYSNRDALERDREKYFFGGDVNSVSITVKITRITNFMTNSTDEESVIIGPKDFKHGYGDKISVPTLIDGKGIRLIANSKYKVELTSSYNLPCWKWSDCVNGHKFDHGTFYCSLVYNNGVGLFPCHILHFTYTVAED